MRCLSGIWDICVPRGMALGGGRELQHCSKPMSSPVLHVLVGALAPLQHSHRMSAPGLPAHPMRAEGQAACGAALFPTKLLSPATLSGDTSRIHGVLVCVHVHVPAMGSALAGRSHPKAPSGPTPLPSHHIFHSHSKPPVQENVRPWKTARPCQPGHIPPSPPPQPLDSQTTCCPVLGSPVSHPSWLPTPPVQDSEHPELKGACFGAH